MASSKLNDWWSKAKCRGTDTELFFRADRDADLRAELLKTQCGICPVRTDCLRDNLFVPWGMYGGYTYRDRRRLAQKHGVSFTKWKMYFNDTLSSYDLGMRKRMAAE